MVVTFTLLHDSNDIIYVLIQHTEASHIYFGTPRDLLLFHELGLSFDFVISLHKRDFDPEKLRRLSNTSKISRHCVTLLL